MASGRSNNKSTQIASRVTHELIEEMEKVKDADESTGKFIVAALRDEIKRRQRKLAKDAPEK